MDLERLTNQVLDKIDFRAADEGERNRVDQDDRTVPLDDEIVGQARGVELERVLKSRATASRYAYSERRAARLRRQNPGDSLGGAMGNAYFGDSCIHFVLGKAAESCPLIYLRLFPIFINYLNKVNALWRIVG